MIFFVMGYIYVVGNFIDVENLIGNLIFRITNMSL